MKIKQLQIENLRVIQTLTLEPGNGINFICGPNGAGKTSVLEAIYLLGQGKSFRHAEAGPFIRNGETSCLVVAETDDRLARSSRLGIQRGRKSFLARHGGIDIRRRSELLRLLPVQIITPQSHELLERGPELRRRYLDFGLFHVEQSYHQVLMSYQRGIKQRNAALRSGNGRLAISFDEQLAGVSETIVRLRRGILETIESNLARFMQEMSFPNEVKLQFSPGWKEDVSLEKALKGHLERDLAQGYTSVGPHRAELKILVGGRRAEKYLSRGQQKVLVYGLVLSLSQLIVEKEKEPPVLLIDDLGAELDTLNRTRIVDYLSGREEQVFITSVDQPANIHDRDNAVFHVEHGCLQ
ncbi:DNA replication and repair protein RecF [Thiolapillus brandeum]|uniref:DNA replication and repair protein RecF n=2 Tax=Thiolapillus brandeum TaxID=1076588 RepID=A0A7U6JFE8_9GAMM|nr:DNA replication and repair protein RecF [Thiolapillus brandeum]